MWVPENGNVSMLKRNDIDTADGTLACAAHTLTLPRPKHPHFTVTHNCGFSRCDTIIQEPRTGTLSKQMPKCAAHFIVC